MICPECQHDTSEHTSYGCYEGEAIVREDELAALREKAALFDVLAQRIEAGEWEVAPWIEPADFSLGPPRVTGVVTRVHCAKRDVYGATLAEAIEKAMEAEGDAMTVDTVCDAEGHPLRYGGVYRLDAIRWQVRHMRLFRGP